MTGATGLILHVDDEQSVREALALLLRADGYVVRSAANGAEALGLAKQGFNPDVLILDFNLNDKLNGAEVSEQMRRVLKYSPPVVMLTGDVAAARTPAGVDAPCWLTQKPLNPQRLLAALPGLVGVSRAMRSLPA